MPSISGKYWQFPQNLSEPAQEIANQCQVSYLTAQILQNRGFQSIDSAKRFLNPKIRQELSDPFELLDCEKSVNLVINAIKNHKKIVIWGDYDVDGATSASLLFLYFKAIGIAVQSYFPNRHTEGYGPNPTAIKKLADAGAEMFISVDCGIVAFDAIAMAKSCGCEFIVIDHHHSEQHFPDADAIINPNRYDETSQYKYLAAVGVCFLFLVALNRELRKLNYFNDKIKEPNLLDYIDIVALGTVADVVPLVGLNRAFVHQGCKIIADNPSLGIDSLCQVSAAKEFNSSLLGFQLGPRLNAGGRIGKSSLGFELLSANNQATATKIALELHLLNEQRKMIEAEILEQAIEAANDFPADLPYIIVSGHDWHIGVVGIIASRIKDRFLKPCIAIAWHNGIGQGSARSVHGVHIGAMIIGAKNQQILMSGGGHAMAGGLKIAQDKIDDFQDFIKNFMNQLGHFQAPKTMINIDACLPLSALSQELVAELSVLEPFGAGNLVPNILIENCALIEKKWLKEKHLQCVFQDDISGNKIRTMMFNAVGMPLAHELSQTKNGRKFAIVGQLKISSWNGNIELMLEDAIAS